MKCSTIKNSNVLIVLGNGHNLGMGLRTRYTDFAEKYLASQDKYPESELYNRLCELYKDSKDNLQWFDIEGELKKFAISKCNDSSHDNLLNENKYFQQLRHDLGFYMDGEAKYWFLECNDSPEGEKTVRKMMDSLPVFLLECILKQNYTFSIISFNYTWIELLLNKLASKILYVPYEKGLGNQTVINYYEERLDINYVHLSGNTCILGIDDDENIPKELSFFKKKYQFDSAHYYPNRYDQYKLIMIYGHSLGKTDSDFVKLLFGGVMSRPIEENPKYVFVTKDKVSMKLILENISIHLKCQLAEIEQHVIYEFILTDELSEQDSRLKLESVLFDSI